jgi:hypothetical protein
MATHKGSALALTLYKMGGGKPWDTEYQCSLIMRNAATYTRLAEEACSGPRWSWTYSGDWTARVNVEEWQARNERDTERCAARLARLVAELPATEHGAVRVAVGGDPRGFTVRLLVPTGPGEVTEVGCDESGHHVGRRERVTA